MTTTPTSPESNPRPQPGEVQGDTSIHPEGVRPFDRQLGEVADELQIPSDASPINPDTRDVTFDRLDRKKPKSRRGIYGALGAAAATVATLAAVFAGSHGGEDTPKPQPEQSAPAVPGGEASASPESEAAPENSAETDGLGTTFDTMNMNVAAMDDPSIENSTVYQKFGETYAEFANEIGPVTTDKFKTPVEAAEQFGNLMSYRDLTGRLGMDLGETDASVDVRQQIDGIMFADDTVITQETMRYLDERRTLLATEFASLNVLGNNVTDMTPTYREQWSAGEFTQQGDAYVVELTSTVHSNLKEIDSSFSMSGVPANSSEVSHASGYVTLTQVDGQWKIYDLVLNPDN